MSAPQTPLSPKPPPDVSQLLDSPEMQELMRQRRRFFRWSLSVFFGSLAVLFGWAALAPSGFGTPIGGGTSLGLLVGLVFVVVVFTLTTLYARQAEQWDVLIERLAERWTAESGSQTEEEG
ncbi:DUF485 domain-containing protein [Streptomyces sp. OE57]|uniref:DUF485 domain-containing protein n=1 Tax=Streptomyces lacaronensis TaxID=3379885 RepID=UPI0039B7510C